MSGTNGTVPSSKGLSTLTRPKFTPGMLLQHEDLDQLTAYTRELNRLMFRSLFGCGVVCGLVVTPEQVCGDNTIKVAAGLGLDCAGDPIYVPRQQRIVLDVHCAPNPNAVLWVVLCAKVKCCAPRTSMCPPDEDEPESMCTRERDAFEIRVVPERPRCACWCEPRVASAYGDGDATDSSQDDDGEERGRTHSCSCVDPTHPCYADHYDGVCGCDCDEGSGVGCCNCIVLARLDKLDDDGQVRWTADHSVRRFIRPVLMRDPQVAKEKKAKKPKSAAIQQPQIQQPPAAPVKPVEAGATKTRAPRTPKV